MLQTAELVRCQTAEEVVSNLPGGGYSEHYQPTYPDTNALVEAVSDVQSTGKVTTPEQVQDLRAQFADIGSGKVNRPITITGRCAEPVNARPPIESLVDENSGQYRICCLFRAKVSTRDTA